MTATQDNAVPDPQQIIAELQRKLDEARAELAARNSAYTERIAYQAAANDVLKVMSGSPGDPQPVFDLIVERARDLCGGYGATVYQFDGTLIHWRAATGVSDDPSARRVLEAMYPMGPTREWPAGRAIIDRQIIRISDLDAEPGLNPAMRGLTVKSSVLVPLVRGGLPIGAVALGSRERGGFTDTQTELLKTFAEQAVIAITSAETYRELQQRTGDLQESLQFQTATFDVLKVISRSPDALQPVLDAIVDISRQLCNTDASTIFLLRDGKFHVAAVTGLLPTHLELLRANPIPVDQPGSVLYRVARERRTLSFANVADDPELAEGITGRGGPRALLSVPLICDGQVIGVISLRQSHLIPFTPRQVQAVEVFADQAVIAISNVNLFEQVQHRTRELSQSLDDLRTAQDRLIQTEKLASLGQLTAGIAHEIKNPLNFVNNFSALSAELIEEMKDVLSEISVGSGKREEIDELTRMLKSNLEKVVQHGKRADSIVKNMLQHSREGSGEHRSADINAIVDESLNLAYHGARAEKPGFSIVVRRELDPSVGTADIYPQEITRVLLNLISNGFYAATKRQEQAGDAFEPTLSAMTKNLGDKVEIRIRDNGIGIPQEVRAKIFNPFFTTKPSGEGTGLGLSMSHDIIVKQHGGSIDVESSPGNFTEFRIVLPRTR